MTILRILPIATSKLSNNIEKGSKLPEKKIWMSFGDNCNIWCTLSRKICQSKSGSRIISRYFSYTTFTLPISVISNIFMMLLLDFDVSMGNIHQYSHPSSPMAILLQLAYPVILHTINKYRIMVYYHTQYRNNDNQWLYFHFHEQK